MSKLLWNLDKWRRKIILGSNLLEHCRKAPQTRLVKKTYGNNDGKARYTSIIRAFHVIMIGPSTEIRAVLGYDTVTLILFPVFVKFLRWPPPHSSPRKLDL